MINRAVVSFKHNIHSTFTQIPIDLKDLLRTKASALKFDPKRSYELWKGTSFDYGWGGGVKKKERNFIMFDC